MKIDYHRHFKKDFRKLTAKQQQQFARRLALFINDPTDPQLRVHVLSGELEGIVSFSVSGDLRAHFRHVEKGHIILVRIGTHSQLY